MRSSIAAPNPEWMFSVTVLGEDEEVDGVVAGEVVLLVGVASELATVGIPAESSTREGCSSNFRFAGYQPRSDTAFRFAVLLQ